MADLLHLSHLPEDLSNRCVCVSASVLSHVQDELPFIQPPETCPSSAPSRSFFTPPSHFRNVLPTASSSSSAQPLFSPGPVSSASSTPSGTMAPAAAPPPGKERHIDHLLEEVMMGLNIIPTNNDTPPTAGVLQGDGSCSTANSETLVVQQQQQQGEGELNDILDRFLMTFEQHINNSAAWEEVSAQSCAEVAHQGDHTRQQLNVAEAPGSDLQLPKSQRDAQDHKHTAATLRSKSARTRRTSSLKSNRVNAHQAREVWHNLQDKQLQQIAVVKLKRAFLPLRVNLQDPRGLNTKVIHTDTFILTLC